MAAEIPRFNAKISKFTVEDLMSVYEDVIYEVEDDDSEVPEEEHGDAGAFEIWLLHVPKVACAQAGGQHKRCRRGGPPTLFACV